MFSFCLCRTEAQSSSSVVSKRVELSNIWVGVLHHSLFLYYTVILFILFFLLTWQHRFSFCLVARALWRNPSYIPSFSTHSHTAHFLNLFWFGVFLAKGRVSHATLQNCCLKAPWADQHWVICHTIKKALIFLLSGTVLRCPHLTSFFFFLPFVQHWTQSQVDEITVGVWSPLLAVSLCICPLQGTYTC